ncbi:MAG: aminoglycoside phosphotransferase family protein, partial [Planctomycetaceae bacterium]|nr:aminoglycoside phosphotransferase family protein [Planctomycetaceae bacterium]
RSDGVVQHSDAVLTPLTGGVSSEICLVVDGPRRFVVKRALPKLKVAADWFADVRRNQHEWEYIRYVQRFLPDAVPTLIHCSADHSYFAMEHLADDFQNWKRLLLNKHLELTRAGQAGVLLARIHSESAGDEQAKRLFDTTDGFFQLRIEPYLVATGLRHPDLQSLFMAEAARLAATRECLVHGDFSPKNILVSPERMVLLDCEVAWYGDPAFDLAFMLNHFLLKALFHAPVDVGMNQMVDAFITAYQQLCPLTEVETRVANLLLMLMLARVDGKSPVEYLDSVHHNLIRSFTRRLLQTSVRSLNDVTEPWFDLLLRMEQ